MRGHTVGAFQIVGRGCFVIMMMMRVIGMDALMKLFNALWNAAGRNFNGFDTAMAAANFNCNRGETIFRADQVRTRENHAQNHKDAYI